MSDETEMGQDAATAPDAPAPDLDPAIVERVSAENMRLLENIDVTLTVEVGKAQIKIRDLLRLNEGSVIELERLAGEALDILANGTMVAKGEVVMVGERFGVRFTEIVDPEARMESI
ncbi:MAG: flagellar motor switch protein FliN [Bacteroidetes bacterium]|jgi:flagellar motor switch protein FliN/FliY|nr:flagellar motor switch protein FliN [Bacteroidota bacterium]